jgi:hypothetical protein
MKKLTGPLAIFALSLTLLSGSAFAAKTESATVGSEPFGSYLNMSVGGEFFTSGNFYKGTNTRFQVQFEPGGKMFAFPINISFGQSIFMAGMKPRLQYFFAPVSSLPNLWVGPGAGFVVNYWKLSGGSGSTGHIIELGIEAEAQLQYRFGMFHVSFTPVALDMNFWRKIVVDAGILSGVGTNKDFCTTYSVMAGAGINF